MAVDLRCRKILAAQKIYMITAWLTNMVLRHFGDQNVDLWISTRSLGNSNRVEKIGRPVYKDHSCTEATTA